MRWGAGSSDNPCILDGPLQKELKNSKLSLKRWIGDDKGMGYKRMLVIVMWRKKKKNKKKRKKIKDKKKLLYASLKL